MYLEIPDELREAFIRFVEFGLDELLLNFGEDLPEDDIQIIELLGDFTERARNQT